MTRKNRTVNPQAGTLKQENRALRTNIKSMTVKLIAFALFILVSIPNMSFVPVSYTHLTLPTKRIV